MKTLYIIRHAKSSWDFELEDHDRPLNSRGRADVRKIGQYLSHHEETPDLMISSTASRALYTALFIADEWGYAEDEIRLYPTLYHASPKTILEILSEIKGANSVALFGHNPGLTDLINLFDYSFMDNLPTCGVCSFTFDIASWKEIKNAKGQRKADISPKNLRSLSH